MSKHDELKEARRKEREERAADASDTSTMEYLAELASVDEVSAWIPTGADHDAGVTPPWTELVLEVTRTDDGELTPAWPLNVRMPLRRHDGELIIEVLHQSLHPNAGLSIAQMIWHELDQVVDAIQKRVAKGKEPLKRDVGQAYGLALALAIMTAPYSYDVDAIREEAMERWERRNG